MSAPKLSEAQQKALRHFANPDTGHVCVHAISGQFKRTVAGLMKRGLLTETDNTRDWLRITPAGRTALENSK